MKLLNRDTDFAIKSLIHISRDKSRKISVAELAEELDIPHAFLRKIFQRLNREGVLHSFKGKGGGFLVTLPPDKILLTDLIKIFQGPVKLTECIFRRKVCPDIKTCSLREKMSKLEKFVVLELQAITIASLMKGKEAAHLVQRATR